MSLRAYVLGGVLAAGLSPAGATPSGQAVRPAQADVVLFGPRVTNLEPAVAAALGDAVRDALRDAIPDARLVDPAVADERLGTAGTPEATARAFGADMWITVRAIRLESMAEVALTRHRSGMRPVVVRAPLPPVDDMPAAARGWVARLVAAPEADPPPPLPADERVHDRVSWGMRAGGAWSVADVSRLLVDVAAEAHSRSGRWFMAGSLGGRLPVFDDPDGRYAVAAARLRSGLYTGSGTVWPALWLGIEPRMLIGDGGAQFGLMPVVGVGLDLSGMGRARYSIDLEVGYNLVDLDTVAPDAPTDEAAAETDGVQPKGPQPVEIGLTFGVGW